MRVECTIASTPINLLLFVVFVIISNLKLLIKMNQLLKESKCMESQKIISIFIFKV